MKNENKTISSVRLFLLLSVCASPVLYIYIATRQRRSFINFRKWNRKCFRKWHLLSDSSQQQPASNFTLDASSMHCNNKLNEADVNRHIATHTHTHWWRRKCCVHGDAERTLSSWFHSVWNWYWCLTIWQMLLRLFCNRDEDLKRKYTLNTRQFQSVSRANTLMVGWFRYFVYFFVFFLRSIYICGPWVSKTTATYVAKID